MLSVASFHFNFQFKTKRSVDRDALQKKILKMPMTLSLNYPQKGKISSTLKNFYEEKLFFDITIFGKDSFEKIRAHKIVLATISEKFKELLMRNDGVLVMPDFTYKQIQSLIELIYFERVSLTQRDFNGFEECAKFFDIKYLVGYKEDVNDTTIKLKSLSIKLSKVRNEKFDVCKEIVSKPKRRNSCVESGIKNVISRKRRRNSATGDSGFVTAKSMPNADGKGRKIAKAVYRNVCKRDDFARCGSFEKFAPVQGKFALSSSKLTPQNNFLIILAESTGVNVTNRMKITNQKPGNESVVVVDDLYISYYNRETEDMVYYKCDQRKCEVNIRYNKFTKEGFQLGLHNHGPNWEGEGGEEINECLDLDDTIIDSKFGLEESDFNRTFSISSESNFTANSSDNANHCEDMNETCEVISGNEDEIDVDVSSDSNLARKRLKFDEEEFEKLASFETCLTSQGSSTEEEPAVQTNEKSHFFNIFDKFPFKW